MVSGGKRTISLFEILFSRAKYLRRAGIVQSFICVNRMKSWPRRDSAGMGNEMGCAFAFIVAATLFIYSCSFEASVDEKGARRPMKKHLELKHANQVTLITVYDN